MAEVEQELAASAPNGIPVIGGGEAVLNARDPKLGTWWICKVVDLDNPQSHDQLSINVSSGDGWSFNKVFRANEDVELPAVAIAQFERATVVKTERMIPPGSSGGYEDPSALLRMNPGCRAEWRDGILYLVKERPRYMVQRRPLGAPEY